MMLAIGLAGRKLQFTLRLPMGKADSRNPGIGWSFTDFSQAGVGHSEAGVVIIRKGGPSIIFERDKRFLMPWC